MKASLRGNALGFFESCFQSQGTCGACWYSNWVKYFQGKATRKAGQIFMISINLLKEQCLFCSSLEHWDRADHSGCLGCGGAGGVVVMLSRQSQWPHSPWPDMWSPAPSTERHKIDNIVYLEIKFTPLVLHHSKPNKDEIFTQDVYTSKYPHK